MTLIFDGPLTTPPHPPPHPFSRHLVFQLVKYWSLTLTLKPSSTLYQDETKSCILTKLWFLKLLNFNCRDSLLLPKNILPTKLYKIQIKMYLIFYSYCLTNLDQIDENWNIQSSILYRMNVPVICHVGKKFL